MMRGKAKKYLFVLWGEGFDETITTVFVTELREVGLLVKVVGLSARHTSGARGLVLVPDLTMEQALPLAGQAIAVIVPTSALQSHASLNSDPRVPLFLAEAETNRATFVLGRGSEQEPVGVELPPSVSGKVLVYPKREEIIFFARYLADLLWGRI
jgi:hypothetical protein